MMMLSEVLATASPKAVIAVPTAIGPTLAELESIEIKEEETAIAACILAGAKEEGKEADEELDDVIPIDDFDDACEELEKCYHFLDTVVDGILIEAVTMPDMMIKSVEETMKGIHAFLNLYMVFPHRAAIEPESSQDVVKA